MARLLTSRKSRRRNFNASNLLLLLILILILSFQFNWENNLNEFTVTTGKAKKATVLYFQCCLQQRFFPSLATARSAFLLQKSRPLPHTALLATSLCCRTGTFLKNKSQHAAPKALRLMDQFTLQALRLDQMITRKDH